MSEESKRIVQLALESNRNTAYVLEVLRGIADGTVAFLRDQIALTREAINRIAEDRKAKAEPVQSVQVPMPQDPVSVDPVLMEPVKKENHV